MTNFKMYIISDKSDTLHVAVHERLGDVLKILRSVLERYPALQSSELLATAGTLIQQVKGNMLWWSCQILDTCKMLQTAAVSLIGCLSA